MRLFRGFRERGTDGFLRKYECEREIAELGAMAMYPFENQHATPNRVFEKEIRRLSRQFTHELRSLATEEEFFTRARWYVKNYLALAQSAGDTYYARSWRLTLAAAARDGESGDDAFSLDPISERRARALASSPDDAIADPSTLGLSAPLRDYAIGRMLLRSSDAHSREAAGEWVDFEVRRLNWNHGWIKDRPDPPPKLSYYSDLDVKASVDEALLAADIHPESYFKTPPSSRPEGELPG